MIDDVYDLVKENNEIQCSARTYEQKVGYKYIVSSALSTRVMHHNSGESVSMDRCYWWTAMFVKNLRKHAKT